MQNISLALVMCGCLAVYASTDNQQVSNNNNESNDRSSLLPVNSNNDNNETPHFRAKRTIFLKKKLIKAGLLGFGLGVAKGLV